MEQKVTGWIVKQKGHDLYYSSGEEGFISDFSEAPIYRVEYYPTRESVPVEDDEEVIAATRTTTIEIK
jgi:hypothetical protein